MSLLWRKCLSLKRNENKICNPRLPGNLQLCNNFPLPLSSSHGPFYSLTISSCLFFLTMWSASKQLGISRFQIFDKQLQEGFKAAGKAEAGGRCWGQKSDLWSLSFAGNTKEKATSGFVINGSPFSAGQLRQNFRTLAEVTVTCTRGEHMIENRELTNQPKQQHAWTTKTTTTSFWTDSAHPNLGSWTRGLLA